MADVKNIVEVVEALELIGVTAKSVMKDGKVDLTDLPHAMSLISQANKIVVAVEGIDQVIPEAKDLDGEEAKLILEKVLSAIKAVKAA